MKTTTIGNMSYAKLNDFDLWITTKGIEKKLLNSYKKLTSIKEVEIKSIESSIHL